MTSNKANKKGFRINFNINMEINGIDTNKAIIMKYINS